MLKKPLFFFVALAVVLTVLVPSSSFAEGKPKSNQFWWPELLDLGQLRSHDARSNPYGDDFDYAKAFNSVDLKELKADSN